MKKKYHWLTRLFIAIAFVGLVLFGLARIYYRATDDFRLSNIIYEMPFQSKWEINSLTPSEKEQLDHILDQKFTYLGKGAQSYAFTSDDQQYVLKFFKFKHLRPLWIVNILPNISPIKEFKERESERKLRKLHGVFDGYRLAYDVNKDESGLIFIQLNPNQNFNKKVTVIDKIGLERTIDLNSVIFIVQHKGKTLRTVLNDLLSTGNVAKFNERVNQIFDLYFSEYHKGIYDRDHGVMHNTGFVGDKPIHLDVGKLSEDEMIKQPQNYKEDLQKIVNKITSWVQQNYPQYYKEIAKNIEDKLSEKYGETYKVLNSEK